MSGRYEPRRRAVSARDHHAIAPKAGSHRQAKRRRRAGLFAFTLTLTLLVGAAGIGLLPRLHGAVPASAVDATVITSSSMETAELAIVEAPPEPKPTEVPAEKPDAAADEALPANSGTGRRVVFSESEQRVWLVNLDGTIDRTYKVSGSIHDNLSIGTYAVQSHTRYATSYDYTSHMEYFVRFTSGPNAPIGFHDIPVSNSGSLVQTVQQLGTPLSSGCIRQARLDAIRLWEFAPVGTKVVVLA